RVADRGDERIVVGRGETRQGRGAVDPDDLMAEPAKGARDATLAAPDLEGESSGGRYELEERGQVVAPEEVVVTRLACPGRPRLGLFLPRLTQRQLVRRAHSITASSSYTTSSRPSSVVRSRHCVMPSFRITRTDARFSGLVIATSRGRPRSENARS